MGDLFVLTLALAAAYCWFLAENPTTAMVLLAGADVIKVAHTKSILWNLIQRQEGSAWFYCAPNNERKRYHVDHEGNPKGECDRREELNLWFAIWSP